MDLCLQAVTLCRKSADAETEKQKKANRKIDSTISKSKAALRKEQKILLLGAGECGKSTFIKQMRIILQGGFPEEQYEYYLRVVHKNLHQAGASLADAMKTLSIPYHNQGIASSEVDQLIESFNEEMVPCLLDKATLWLIKRLWADSGVQQCYDRRREYNLLDSAKYFLDRIPEIEKPDFRVELQDILRTRVRTTAIIEEIFSVDRINLKIIDVGGQRRERRKWIHSFEGVTSVIFLASLSEYDMFLQEDPTKNRTAESLQLFKTILNYPWFKNSSLILFLNKKDLFAEKVPFSYIGDYFPEYDGAPTDVEYATRFISELYQCCYMESSTINDARTLFVHMTCATDTENIRIVFENVKSTVLQKNITELNLG